MNGKDLKRIAMLTMLADHIGFLLIPPGPVYFLLRTIGRLSFPLFCFLLVEGFFHTGDVKRYGRNLLLFAVISEIPFNLVCGGSWFFPAYQNVFFTLFLGLCMMACLRQVHGEVWSAAVVLLFAAAAWTFQCDYHALGILMIAFLYRYRTGSISIAVPAVFAALLSLGNLCAAAISMVFIYFYDGTRGKQGNKYVYYLFYPIHLLILYLLSGSFGCFLGNFQL